MMMSLVDPIQPAIEVWLVLWDNLPLAVRNLANLTLGLFVVVVMFKTFFHLRG